MRKIPKDLHSSLTELAQEAGDWPEADVLQGHLDRLEDARDDAEGYYGDRSERWQESDKGEEYQEWIDSICDVIDALRSVIEADNDEREGAIDDFTMAMENMAQTPGG